jgi:hypothetical protein
MTDSFDPADAGCWMARGRPAHHAHALADAWRRFPDLPNDAPLDARMARSRERVQALRPLNEAIAQETERQRVAANFACIERQIAQGSTDSRNPAILHGRDVHGYGWDAAVAYADGLYAARGIPMSDDLPTATDFWMAAANQTTFSTSPVELSLPHPPSPIAPRMRSRDGRSPASGRTPPTSRHRHPGIAASFCSARLNSRRARSASWPCYANDPDTKLSRFMPLAPKPGSAPFRSRPGLRLPTRR